jgi:hypothetical protein
MNHEKPPQEENIGVTDIYNIGHKGVITYFV